MTRDKQSKIKLPEPPPTFVERCIDGIGSVTSLIVHTILFATCFIIAGLGFIAWELMLLVLTTIVSLEAIYLALFIQITVNRNTESLREVEEDIEEISEDIDEIQEDVEELGEDLEDIQEDIEEINEDIGEISEDIEELNEDEQAEEQAAAEEKRGKKATKAEMLEKLSMDVARLLEDLEELKKSK